jgi:hypothetical protein
MRFAYVAIIHPIAKMPIAARITATGVATPAPSPVAPAPTIRGRIRAAEKTGPMNPTDCASTSMSLSLLAPNRS